ncbi:MAG: DUF6371 domain-containing protein [Patescibacteria group bacterium]|nr:DUF6371 domain-containing protein [Patescibacteria group bacterium]
MVIFGNSRFILEPYKGLKSRYVCPNCGKKEFVRYIDTETGKHLATHVGKCNRELKCGYHFKPREYFKDNPVIPKSDFSSNFINPKARAVSFIPEIEFKASLKDYEVNHLVNFLLSKFEVKTVQRLIETYFIGTSDKWKGATVFWQIDMQKNVRTGKIMLYEQSTGKRVKEPYNHIGWVHNQIKDFHLNQCLFGLHLVSLDNKPIAIVESEKTAIISSVYFPEMIWLACGGLNQLNIEKLEPIKSRKIILFPDLKAFDKWEQKAKELASNGFNIQISDYLEQNATKEQKENGFDLADYLLNLPEPTSNEPEPQITLCKEFQDTEQNEYVLPILPSDFKANEAIQLLFKTFELEIIQTKEPKFELISLQELFDIKFYFDFIFAFENPENTFQIEKVRFNDVKRYIKENVSNLKEWVQKEPKYLDCFKDTIQNIKNLYFHYSNIYQVNNHF